MIPTRSPQSMAPSFTCSERIHIMSSIDQDSLVPVYKSSVDADAKIVQNMLISHGIRATVSESDGPFTGLVVAPSEVLVWQSDEARARRLIGEAADHSHGRGTSED